MDFRDAISKALDAITVTRVYGEPYECDGAVLIPPQRSEAAAVVAAARMRPEAAPVAAAASASAPVRWARMWSRAGMCAGSRRST